METQTPCPVCGHVNTRKHWSEHCVGTVEEYYYCEKCGYFSEMAYSPVHEGVRPLKFPSCIRQIFVLVSNAKNLKGLKLGLPYM